MWRCEKALNRAPLGWLVCPTYTTLQERVAAAETVRAAAEAEAAVAAAEAAAEAAAAAEEAVRLAEEQSDLERLRAVEANIAKLSVEVMEHTDVGGKLV